MKIGLVSPYNIFKSGGVQECILATQAELQKRGHTAVIITPQPRGYDGPTPDNMIFLGGSADFKSPFATTAQVSATASGERVEQVLEEQKFDLLHFHEPWIPIISRQILTRSNTINVATFHSKMPDTRVSKTLERVITPYTKSILKYIDVFTAVSEPATDYLRQLSDAEITIIPNGIDLTKYSVKPRAKLSAPTIFYIGRLEKRKGVKYLLRAFALVQAEMPNAQLLIAGDGPDRKKLTEYADELGLQNVEFLGYIEDADKIHLMQSADVFCSPAVYGESFGIVLLEAMACGRPVVAGANPGYASVLRERGALGLVTPKDSVDFSRRLLLFLSDKGMRDTWNDWSLDYIKQFDYPRIVDQYEKLYKKACKEHKRA